MLKIGHRGAKGHVAENTLASFQKALDIAVDGIELDVHLSKDNVVVVVHDETIDRTTTSKGFVNNFTFSNLKKLGIPTLEEVINLVDTKCFINIEIKVPEATFEVLKILKKHKSFLHLFQVSSFDWTILESISKLNPQIYLGVLTEDTIENALTFAKKIKAKSINPNFKLLDKEKVTLLQRNGFQVFAWTVNDIPEIEEMKSFNVDGIISDFPDRI